MKSLIDRVFAKKDQPPLPPPVHSGVSSELTTGDIESYYLRIITECIRRLLVQSDAVEIGVKRAGVGPEGLSAFAGYVRILRWDKVMTPVLLQNMPVIDARIRKVVAASVILEHTHFAGLWFQACADAQGAPDTLVGMPSGLVHQPGRSTP
jgi:hypothetical protein